MKNSVWKKAVKLSADPERAEHFLKLLAGAAGQPASARDAEILAALFSGSPAMGNLLVARPQWLAGLNEEQLKFPRRDQGLRREANDHLKPLLAAKDYAAAMGWLREFKQREMLRIAARDLARMGTLPEIVREISNVADVVLEAVLRVCQQQLRDRFGQPWHQDADGRWQPTEFCVLGLGKLGGQELNYSSDVDVLFVYTEEGQVFREPPAKNKSPTPVMASHQFFNRLAEFFIAEISRMTPSGMLFRIDLRLRPEGDSGPLCRSLGSYETYYAQWGQTWERMMLIKARWVAGSGELGAEFLEMAQPFRYPRIASRDVLHEIGAMKDRIETEVVRTGELDRNVKLGQGGIREIEFFAQAQQLLHAGGQPFLQGAQTLPCLEKLVRYHLVSEANATALREAYIFLRDVEHRLQMEENLQTHAIPAEPVARRRLAKLMGFDSARAFEAARRRHAGHVRRLFEGLLKSEHCPVSADSLPAEFSGAEEEWKRILTEHSFRDPDAAFQLLREFAEGPGYVHVSPRTTELARRLLPRLFALCPASAGRRPAKADGPRLSDPDRVVTRLDSFISKYGARAVLFELWRHNPAIFELLVLLFDRSEFLAELAIRTPDMVDELVASGRLRQRKTAEETLRDLRHGIGDKDQNLWLRRYHQTELMRIGLRDILGLADPEQYLTELSALADACLQYALEAALSRRGLKTAPLAIIGLGKLGGSEIDYGSDLDILFVAGDRAKDLRRLQPIALDVMNLVSDRTEMGIVFQTDARLRPDGEKGLLVNTLSAYEEYYRHRAQLWEIQSLSRARPSAGDRNLGGRFQQMAADLSNFQRPSLPLAAYTAAWKEEIHKMRLRIEKERTPAGQDALAIKTGRGGLMDAEFIAQALCLEHGWQEPNTLRALERAKEAGALPDADAFIQNYRRLRRVEGILRRWSYEGETVLPDDPAPYYRVAVRCGYETADAFRAAMAACRAGIRKTYLHVFSVNR